MVPLPAAVASTMRRRQRGQRCTGRHDVRRRLCLYREPDADRDRSGADGRRPRQRNLARRDASAITRQLRHRPGCARLHEPERHQRRLECGDRRAEPVGQQLGRELPGRTALGRYFNSSDDPSALARTISFVVNDGALSSAVASNDRHRHRGQRCAGRHDVRRRARLYREPGRHRDRSGTDARRPRQRRCSPRPRVTIIGQLRRRPGSSSVFTNQNGISGSLECSDRRAEPDGSRRSPTTRPRCARSAISTAATIRVRLARTVSFVVNDGALSSAIASKTVTVTAVNDAPVVTTSGGALAYTENQAATAIDPALTLADLDNVNLAGATVTIIGQLRRRPGRPRLHQPERHQRQLECSDRRAEPDRAAVRSPTTRPHCARSAISTPATIRARSRGRSRSSSTTARWTAQSRARTVARHRGQRCAGRHDRPAARLPIPRTRPPTAIDPALTLADLDNTTLARRHASRSPATSPPARTALVFADQNGISGSWNAATGVLSLSGSRVGRRTTRPHCARSAYFNTSDDPSALTRTISFSRQRRRARQQCRQPRPSGHRGQRCAGRRRLRRRRWPIPRTRSPTAIDPALTLADVDNTTLAVGHASRSRPTSPAGEDRLVFTDQNGISGSLMPRPAC